MRDVKNNQADVKQNLANLGSKDYGESMKMILAIAVGGAIGAVARHYVAYAVATTVGQGFPWGIVVVNILGSFLMGCLVETSALMWSPSVEMRAFMMVGVLGAFTTFSTFSLDVVLLIERGQMAAAASYIIISVICAIGALFVGMALMRGLLT